LTYYFQEAREREKVRKQEGKLLHHSRSPESSEDGDQIVGLLVNVVKTPEIYRQPVLNFTKFQMVWRNAVVKLP